MRLYFVHNMYIDGTRAGVLLCVDGDDAEDEEDNNNNVDDAHNFFISIFYGIWECMCVFVEKQCTTKHSFLFT